MRARIDACYPSLTPAERQIADHISGHYRELAYAGASQLARELGLAVSTLVRFAQKLGYPGYPNLQAALQREYGQQHRLVDLVPQGPDFLPAYVETEMANLRHLASQGAALAAAADLLAAADRVWVTGDRTSAFTAALGRHLLRMVRPSVSFLGAQAGDVPDDLLDVAPGDAVWVVSMSRYSRRTFRLAEYLHGRLPLVLMCDEHPSPLLPFATVRLRFATDSVTGLRSDVGATAAAQALVMAVAQRIPDAAGRLERAEDLWGEFDVFYKET